MQVKKNKRAKKKRKKCEEKKTISLILIPMQRLSSNKSNQNIDFKLKVI